MTKCRFEACRSFFETEEDLRKHESTAHNRGKVHYCRFGDCEYGTTHKGRLQKHMLAKHPDMPVHKVL
jgi:hypothetical protein